MKIVATRKDNTGTIQQYKLSNGRVVNIAQCIQLVQDHKIEGCNVGGTRNGGLTVRSNPNGVQTDNLSNLPSF